MTEIVPGPAYHIRTPRLLLRCWEPADASLLKEAIDASHTAAPDNLLYAAWFYRLREAAGGDLDRVELLVVAEGGDLDTQLFGHLEDKLSFFSLDFFTVKFESNHGFYLYLMTMALNLQFS